MKSMLSIISPIHFNVYDVIETPGHKETRLYIVAGCHHGALGQESVIELAPMGRNSPDAHGTSQSMFVPLEMLQAGVTAGIFEHTPTDA